MVSGERRACLRSCVHVCVWGAGVWACMFVCVCQTNSILFGKERDMHNILFGKERDMHSILFGTERDMHSILFGNERNTYTCQSLRVILVVSQP